MSKANKQIEFLHHLRVSQKEFEALGDFEKVALSISSYATSESNVLMRLYVCTAHNLIDEKTIDQINVVQRHVVLRIWSAKLFEYHKFLGDLRRKSESAGEVQEICKLQMAEYNRLKKMDGFLLVQQIRNKATSHYLVDQALINVAKVSPRASLDTYLHDMEGNSTSLLGEEVLFNTFLSEFGRRNGGKKTPIELINDWYEWNILANKWLKNSYFGFWKKLILDRDPKKYATKKMFFLPDEMVGELGKDMTPLFVRKSD